MGSLSYLDFKKIAADSQIRHTVVVFLICEFPAYYFTESVDILNDKKLYCHGKQFSFWRFAL